MSDRMFGLYDMQSSKGRQDSSKLSVAGLTLPHHLRQKSSCTAWHIRHYTISWCFINPFNLIPDEIAIFKTFHWIPFLDYLFDHSVSVNNIIITYLYSAHILSSWRFTMLKSGKWNNLYITSMKSIYNHYITCLKIIKFTNTMTHSLKIA